MVGESPRFVETRWVDGLKPHLSGCLDELPPRAQAFVAARIMEERPDSVWLAGDVEDWELHVAGRILKLLEEDQPDRAENLLRQRADRSPTSRLIGLEALVLSSLGRIEEAKTTASRALDLYKKTGVHRDLNESLEKLISIFTEAKAGTVLTAEEIEQIVDIFSSIQVDYSSQTRAKLLEAIPDEYLSRLKLFNEPSLQLLSDLNFLAKGGKLADGSHPLVLWLEAAIKLFGKHPQVKGLEAARSKAARRAGTSPPRKRSK
jgi:hypothetical protein